jgi:hypothetical protein
MALESWRVTFLFVGIPSVTTTLFGRYNRKNRSSASLTFFLTLKAPAACALSSQPIRLGRNRSIPCSKT